MLFLCFKKILGRRLFFSLLISFSFCLFFHFVLRIKSVILPTQQDITYELAFFGSVRLKVNFFQYFANFFKTIFFYQFGELHFLESSVL